MQNIPPESLWIDINKVVLPEETRTHSEKSIQALVDDLNQNGQLQDILVAPKGDHYEVLVGVGRVLAAKKLCWDKIRATVRKGLNEFEKLHATFSVNESRGNPPAVFQAKLLRRMMEMEQLNQASLAERLGKPPALISQYLALTDLSREVEEQFHVLKLPQAIEILRLPHAEDQIEVAKRCIEKDLSRQEIQTIVAWKLAGARKAAAARKVAQPVIETFSEHAVSEPVQARNHFAWRGSKLEIYPKPFIPLKEELNTYMTQLHSDMVSFMTQHPVKAADVEGGDFTTHLHVMAPDPAAEGQNQ